MTDTSYKKKIYMATFQTLKNKTFKNITAKGEIDFAFAWFLQMHNRFLGKIPGMLKIKYKFDAIYNNHCYGGPTFSQLAIIVKLTFSNLHFCVFESSSQELTYNFFEPGSQSKQRGFPP